MDLSVSLLPVLECFKWSGLWFPKDKQSKQYFYYQLCSYFVVVFFFMAHNIFQGIYIISMYDDIPAVAQISSVLIIELAGAVKAYSLLRNMDTIQNFVYKSLNQDSFQPTHPKHLEAFESSLTFWKRSFYIFLTFGRTALCLLGIIPILDKTTTKGLPYLAWYPYDATISPMYELTFIHQMLGTLYAVQVNVAFDTFASGLFCHIGVQCEMLCNRLENMNEESRSELQRTTGNLRCDEGKVIKNKQNVLVRCIKHHKDIVAFSKQVENLINMGVFAQVVASVIILCMTMLQVTLVKPLSTEFFAVISYQTSISFQWFMYCWFGNEVIYKSSNIPIALYKCDWVDNSPAFKKDIQFFMHRTQSALRIYTINFFELSMPTCISIIQSAYSYYAVLRQVNEN